MRAMDWLRYIFPFLLALAMRGLKASATCPPGECAARSRLCPQKELNAISAMRVIGCAVLYTRPVVL